MIKRLLFLTCLILVAIFCTTPLLFSETKWIINPHTGKLDAVSTLTPAPAYYSYPTAWQLKDDDRIPIYQNASGMRTLTGYQLQAVAYRVAWTPNFAKVFQVNSSASAAPNEGNKFAALTRDRRGVVTNILYENGGTMAGIPKFYHRYVYPFNGMTNVSRSTPLVVGTVWSTRGVVVTPSISIKGGPALTLKGLYYAGKIDGLPNFGFWDESGDQSMLDSFFWGTASVGLLEPNTTYTIRSAMPSSWAGANNAGGEKFFSTRAAPGYGIFGINPCRAVFATYSTGAIMVNYSTVLCKSTFRTGSL